jgi:hypothetical protein
MKSTVRFGDGIKYDNGVTPSVAANDQGTLIEVHQSQNGPTLWATVGAFDFDARWGDSSQYDTGVQPSVALNDQGTVVEVHKSETHDTLWCRVGSVDPARKTVSWGASVQYDKGQTPSVALNGRNQVIEVHQSENKDTLWYHVGTVDPAGKTIRWETSHQYDHGICPSVALNDAGTVVEMHQSQNEGTLWYHVGSISTGFGPSHSHSRGVTPSVALNDEGLAVEVHQSDTHETLWSSTGLVSGADIAFDAAVQFDTGIHPAVALNNANAVQCHQSEAQSTLWYSLAPVVDLARWMEATVSPARRLWEVTLPGTHDSGTYHLTNHLAPSSDIPDWVKRIIEFVKGLRPIPVDNFVDSLLQDWSKAQEADLAGQLNAGIRFFDVRACLSDGEFRVHHALVGDPLAKLLDQLAGYVGSIEKELVVLKISHCAAMGDTDHERLIALIQEKIGAYLYRGAGESAADIPNRTIGELVAGQSRVLLIYQEEYIKNHPTPGFWRDIGLYDEYANTHDFATLENDQQTKLLTNYGRPGKLFLLSWTLTADFDLIVADAKNRLNPLNAHGSLHDLSKRANHELARFVAEKSAQYKMNVLYVDFFAESRAVDLAIALARQQQ